MIYILDFAETIASPAGDPLPAYARELYRDGCRFAEVPWDEAAAWRPSPEVVQAVYQIATGRASDPYDPDDVLRVFLDLMPGATEVVP